MKANKQTRTGENRLAPPTFHLQARWQALAALILVLLPFPPAVLAESPKTVQHWSVQVDRVDPGSTILEPSFSGAIYEDLLEELAKTKQFKQVFRSGDRHANDVPDLLILKTQVRKYTPGSETRRAVTTLSGATKLNVRVQLVTQNGQPLFEHVVNGNVRFIGNNLRVTHKLAANVAKTLKRSTLPGSPAPIPPAATGKDSTSTP